MDQSGSTARGEKWLRTRRYAHLDRPASARALKALCTNPDLVAGHAFLPFLSHRAVQRRYRATTTGARQVTAKQRLIAYAGHTDAAVFSYYSHLLSPAFEKVLAAVGASDSVLAYRRFSPPKSNIDFAAEVFESVRSRAPCFALGLDVVGFFDALPHAVIKRQWARLLGATALPADHYAVFKALTKWKHLNRTEALGALGRGRTAHRQWPHRQPLCSPQEFRSMLVPLIQDGYCVRPDGEPVGIPQGSPISGLVSNFAMLDVDEHVSRAAVNHQVLYRRYSDDIMLVGNEAAVRRVADVLGAQLSMLGLHVSQEKLHEVSFEHSGQGLQARDRPLQYLGFTFDGERTLIRSQTIAKFSRRMKSGVRSARRAAVAAAKRGGERRLRRTKLFSMYSHLGPRGHLAGYERGSFWTYVRRSAAKTGSSEIRAQMQRQWPRLLREIQEADES